ncbi:hypothetical protein TEQG_08745 [Trichophyton equinum CBS 127.97]|uniref:Integrase catalytic domain-containing protein n=1 Tax=Trichophyton equinum (strain ATCC MYA-4606 / CBS 127.97) TaxID=559882 RepID=F2PYC3_TRIEC|nr:hypothetical protein TEQG_08745 [Trichophyton equinum CBS 127.97]
MGLLLSHLEGNTFNTLLVIVDILTKFALYISYTKDVKVEGLGYLIFKNVISLFGMPANLVTNRGTLFTCSKRRLSTAFYLQTNSQTERQNQTIEYYLSEALAVALMGYKPEL